MVESASVLSTQRCSSEAAMMRRTAMSSLSQPNTAPEARQVRKPSQSGRCRSSTSQAVQMPPTMANWPVPKLNTFDVEYITL